MPRRSPLRWPNDARIAIIPCVAFENWPDDLGTIDSLQNENRRLPPRNAVHRQNLGAVTDHQYGERVGIYRMLDLFQREGIQTTFFISGILCERQPDLIKEIAALGHEVSTENWIHDYSFMKTAEQERADCHRTVEAVRRLLGAPPPGYLSPGLAATPNTPSIVAEEGYLYWADPQHEELPYTLRVGDKSLVALTYYLYLNDYTTFRGERQPRELLQLWKDAFDYLYREGAQGGTYMAWGNHPFLTGRPYRAAVLEEFIHYAKGFPGVWFTRCVDVARWWREHYREAHVETWPNYQ